MKNKDGIFMKRCPKCHFYNYVEDLACKKCSYQFKSKVKSDISSDQKKEDTDEWPSDEWKDWNTM